MTTKNLAAILIITACSPAFAAEDDLTVYIAGQTAHCWAKPQSLRGISFSATYDVSFNGDGQAAATDLISVEPAGATYQDLAADLSEAFKRCGPYVTEGMREIRVTVSWPGSYGAIVRD